MKVAIRWTYDKTTPESAEHGDHSEYGCWGPGGHEYPLGGCEVDPDDCLPLDAMPEPDEYDTAREAVEAIRWTVGGCEVEVNGGHLSAYACDGTTNYRTGEDTRLAAHLDTDPRLARAMARALETP